MNQVQLKAKEFTSLNEVKQELKRLQSIKCRLAKQKTRKDYDIKMTEVLQQEQLIKEVRSYLEPKKVTVTTMTVEQIQELTYDETVKAIKSIQTKKCLSQYNEDQTEYELACKIEEQLKSHRDSNKPLNDNVVSKKSIIDLIDNLENLESKIEKEYILEQLQNLIK